MTPDNGAARPLKIFCSYAHEDHRYLVELRDTHLMKLEKQGIVEAWDDREIRPGEPWDGEIREQLLQADVIIFLVSPDFESSDYCWDEEVKRAEARAAEGAHLLPIVVRTIHIPTSRFKHLQMIPVAQGHVKPLVDYSRRERAYALILDEIMKIAEEHEASREGPAIARKEDRDGRPLVAGEWPKRTSELVGRDALVRRVADELAAPPGHRVALVGEGGVGKTSVAVEFARQRQDRYDVVAWLHAEERTRLDWDYAELAKANGLPPTDLETARAAFRTWLAEHDRWLLVFDNAVAQEPVRALLPETIRGDVLITSREAVWSDFAREVPVAALAEDDAVEYVLDQTGQTDRAAARELATAASVRCIPRFLEDAVATINAEGIGIREYLGRVQARER
jgi:TIR domain/NB-ARC domain